MTKKKYGVRTVNGNEPDPETGNINVSGEGSQNLQQTLDNGNTAEYDEGNSIIVFLYGDSNDRTAEITVGDGTNRASFTSNNSQIAITHVSPSNESAIGADDGKLLMRQQDLSTHKAIELKIPASISSFTNYNFPEKTIEGDYDVATTDQINVPVSATQSGIVNNIPLQELGGVDKSIHGVNVGIGSSTGTDNTAIGVDSQITVGTGSRNISLGANTLKLNTGNASTAIGYNALSSNTEGGSNTAIGSRSLQANTTGSWNTAVGQGTLQNNLVGNNNVGVGSAALSVNTGSYNTAIGTAALATNIFGEHNTAIGNFALNKNVGVSGSNLFGHRSTAVGSNSMRENTTGNGEAFGSWALSAQTTGNWNIALGNQAASGITTGSNNTIIANAGFVSPGGGITTGNNNLIVAQNLGNTTGVTTGNGNTILGKVTGLAPALNANIVLSDGNGIIGLRKTDTHQLLAPSLTIALINSGGDTSLVTKAYTDQIGSVINTTTTALSGTTLNSTYPKAISLRVHCMNIIGGGVIYEKSSLGWIQYPASVVAP